MDKPAEDRPESDHTPPTATPQLARHDPLAALRHRDFRLYAGGRFVVVLADQMLTVAVGWELYERTGSALALGLVGLIEVLPLFALALIGGHVADHVNRKLLVAVSQLAVGLASLGLALLSATQGPVPMVYGCLLLIGIARAFNRPATSAFLPQTVPPEDFHSAATWSSSTWQLASVLGPGVGGLLIAAYRSAAPVYVLDLIGAIIYVAFILLIKGRKVTLSREKTSLRTVVAGIQFIRQTPIVMAAITLDMFAVLFGGATALLPIYAKDILQVGPEGLGWMRAAPSIGAVGMALLIAYLPPFRKAGKTLLWAVAGFGLATIVFGFSRSFGLSLAMLIILGALDNISVVVRSTLLLTRTPDQVRGRVSAVNSIFIGASNELGAFESGLVASIAGPVIAVVSGGIGTLAVVYLVARKWPEMRRLGKLSQI